MNKNSTSLFDFHNSIQQLNNSKIFAGIMIVILNISSKFVNIKLSKSMESFLKNTFSKYILVFTIVWMGTRDIIIALIITFFFILVVDVLLDDDSMFYILPNNFKEHYVDMFDNEEENMEVSEEEIKKAAKVLEKAKKQKQIDFEGYKN